MLCEVLSKLDVRNLTPENAALLIKSAQQLTASRNSAIKTMSMLAKLARKVPELNHVPFFGLISAEVPKDQPVQ
jgi:hypothetical protein